MASLGVLLCAAYVDICIGNGNMGSEQDTRMSEEKRRISLMRMTIEPLAGTGIEEAFMEMYRLHCETRADIDMVFNGLRVVIADNKMFEKFGYGKPAK